MGNVRDKMMTTSGSSSNALHRRVSLAVLLYSTADLSRRFSDRFSPNGYTSKSPCRDIKYSSKSSRLAFYVPTVYWRSIRSPLDFGRFARVVFINFLLYKHFPRVSDIPSFICPASKTTINRASPSSYEWMDVRNKSLCNDLLIFYRSAK